MDWTESKLTTDGYVGRPCWYIGRPEPSVCVLLIYGTLMGIFMVSASYDYLVKHR